MSNHDFNSLTPPHDQVLQWIESAPNGIALIDSLVALSARWGAQHAAERLAGQWPDPITDRRPTEWDGDGYDDVQFVSGAGRWKLCHWSMAEDGRAWKHTPNWRPPAPPTDRESALAAFDHILRHSTTNLGEALIRRVIEGEAQS